VGENAGSGELAETFWEPWMAGHRGAQPSPGEASRPKWRPKAPQPAEPPAEPEQEERQ
jgi:hypothetical protein